MTVEFDFDKLDGLIPAVLQDADSGAVLMVGFMNREALEKTLRTGYATFFSRTRNRLWTKGETSGNFAQVVSARTDCDRHAALSCSRTRRRPHLPPRYAILLHREN